MLAEVSQRTCAEGFVVITENQFAGKGQRGNTWVAEAGKNLTLSVLFKPTFLLPSKQFYMSMACSLAVADWLVGINIKDVKVKWPNDVYVGNKKIAGILIENQIRGVSIQHSVWGIGININQTNFGEFRATSVYNVSGVQQNLLTCFKTLMQAIEKRYLQLKAGNSKQLKQDYLSTLLAYKTEQQFKDEVGVFTGMIEDVLDTGHIVIRSDKQIKQYHLKEVSLILS
jgi:BirA family biotin operon repressor/biotin-[acetyl-CoA-carboxylase] ligase